MLRNGDFHEPEELKKILPSLDNFKYKDKWWIIDIGGNNLRLIAFIEFRDNRMYVKHIVDHAEYELALALMDERIEDYENQLPLIKMLAAAIERWESSAPEFEEFNRRIDDLDNGTSVLRTLMDQYKRGVADRPEIGTKSLVSKTLNGGRRLTRDHIEALSQRFGLSPALFF